MGMDQGRGTRDGMRFGALRAPMAQGLLALTVVLSSAVPHAQTATKPATDTRLVEATRALSAGDAEKALALGKACTCPAAERSPCSRADRASAYPERRLRRRVSAISPSTPHRAAE